MTHVDSGGSCACVGAEGIGTLYLPLKFARNLKLLLKKQSAEKKRGVTVQ